MLRWRNKDPADVLDYGIDGWAAHLDLPSGETINACTWSASPSGLTLTGSAFAGDKASVRIAAGVAGQDYAVTCRVSTSANQVAERSAMLFVTDR